MLRTALTHAGHSSTSAHVAKSWTCELARTRSANRTAASRRTSPLFGSIARSSIRPASTPQSSVALRIASLRFASSSSRQPSSSSSSSSSKPPKTPPSESTVPSTSDVSWSDVKRIASLSRPETRTLIIAGGLLIVSSAVSMSVPLTFGTIIDLFSSTEADSPSHKLPIEVSTTTAAVGLAVLFGVGALANTGRVILMRLAGQRISYRLRVGAYRSLLRADAGWHDLYGARAAGVSQSTAIKAKKQLEAIAPVSSSPTSAAASSSSSASPASATTQSTSSSPSSESSPSPKRSDKSVSLSPTGVGGVGDLVSRLSSDVWLISDALTRDLADAARSVIVSIGGLAAMLYISAKLTGVMLLVVPPTAIGAVWFGRYLKKLSKKTQEAAGEMTRVAEETLSAVGTVQSCNAVEWEERRFERRTGRILDLARREAWASGIFFGATGFAGNLSMIALLTYGGSLVSQGEMTVGDLTSLLMYTVYIASSLFSLTSFFTTFMKGLGASSRIFTLLDAQPLSVNLSRGLVLPAPRPLPALPPPSADTPSLPPQPVTFRNVTFAYPSRPSSPILKGLDLKLEPGTVTAIAGGSGSGKSTLALLLMRQYDPTEGNITYGDYGDLREIEPASWRARVAAVEQSPVLFGGSVADNIRYGLVPPTPPSTFSLSTAPTSSSSTQPAESETPDDTDQVTHAARLANAHDFISSLSSGYESEVGPRGGRLSGGQKQRVAIARALMRRPEILVMDEATSALDARAEGEVNEAVRKVQRMRREEGGEEEGVKTVVIIAHRLSTLKMADRIVFLQDGKVAEEGTFEELSREGSAFNDLVRSQLLGAGAAPAASQTRHDAQHDEHHNEHDKEQHEENHEQESSREDGKGESDGKRDTA